MICSRHYAVLAALASILLLLAGPAAAKPAHPAGHPAAVHVEDIEKLVSTLEDEGARRLLVGQLKALVAVQRKAVPAEDPGLLAQLGERIDAFGDEVMEGMAALKDLPRAVEWAAAQLADELARKHLGEVLLRLAAVLAVGIAADVGLSLLLRRRRPAVAPSGASSLLVRLPLALGRLLLDLVPVAAFAGAAYGLATLLGLTGNLRVAALTMGAAYASVRLVGAVAGAMAAPRVPALRLLPVDDETAEYLVIWVRRLAGVGLVGACAVEAARLLGLSRGAAGFVQKGLGLAIATMLVIFILQNRQAVAAWLRRPVPRPEASPMAARAAVLQARLADVWHVLAAIYVVAVYGVWAVQVAGGFEFMLRATVLTVVVLGLSVGLSGLLRRGIDRGFAVGQDTRDRFPLLEARANRYLPILHLVLRGTVTVATLIALAQVWGLDMLGLLSSEAGRRVLSAAISIAVTLVAALVVWELVHGAIERYLSATDAEGHAVRRSGRVRTLLPLARNALLLVLVAMVTLIVLSEVGVNIAPLLAGAGVLGIAIGFGSQKLVQDVITGAFILFEDTIAVGDAVRINDAHAGAVEAISVRAIRLRDMKGCLHTIPFSTVTTVVNMSRDFAYAVIDVGVGYREDTDRVEALLKAIGDELKADAVLGPMIVEPMEVLGIERFEASAVVIRCRFKTRPTEQWPVQRAFHRLMKKRFDEHAIEMPFPQTTVWFGDGRKQAEALPTNVVPLAG